MAVYELDSKVMQITLADSIGYKLITKVSLDSHGATVEPTWEKCQRICRQCIKLPQFIIAMIVQLRPQKYIWPKNNWIHPAEKIKW